MKIQHLDQNFSGTWHRDCELLDLKCKPKPLELTYYRDEDATYWKISFDSLVAFKVITEELGTLSYLISLPVDGAFYELSESPWLLELINTDVHFVKKAKHYVFCFYDEVLEVIAPSFTIEQLTNQSHHNSQKV
jgi:hypothetical protein